MEKYIITDPCYIMNEEQYDTICREHNCNFEGQDFPLKSKHRDTGDAIVFHTIEGTPNGDSSCDWYGQSIGVDAGMLCIAYNAKGWKKERFGATFETLAEAREDLPKILKFF